MTTDYGPSNEMLREHLARTWQAYCLQHGYPELPEDRLLVQNAFSLGYLAGVDLGMDAARHILNQVIERGA